VSNFVWLKIWLVYGGNDHLGLFAQPITQTNKAQYIFHYALEMFIPHQGLVSLRMAVDAELNHIQSCIQYTTSQPFIHCDSVGKDLDGLNTNRFCKGYHFHKLWMQSRFPTTMETQECFGMLAGFAGSLLKNIPGHKHLHTTIGLPVSASFGITTVQSANRTRNTTAITNVVAQCQLNARREMSCCVTGKTV
jgi:hypothetical protein